MQTSAGLHDLEGRIKVLIFYTFDVGTKACLDLRVAPITSAIMALLCYVMCENG